MKNLKFIGLILLAILLTSCDNSDERLGTETIVGKWNISNKVSLDNHNSEMNSCVKQSFIQFNDNGTFTRLSYTQLVNGCELQNNDNGNYTYLNNVVTLNYTDTDDGAQVEVFTDVKILEGNLSYNWSETEDGSYDWTFYYTK